MNWVAATPLKKINFWPAPAVVTASLTSPFVIVDRTACIQPTPTFSILRSFPIRRLFSRLNPQGGHGFGPAAEGAAAPGGTASRPCCPHRGRTDDGGALRAPARFAEGHDLPPR